MAMDREKLLAFFQAHYLSRQEVLFKLPLNISIDSFWPELLNHRKARASVLPLSNAAGMPYWYVLTDRMIAASERLCEEAMGKMGQDPDFDPCRAGMTSAMTEEMFFTSFVEGAQIPLQEAMDFLQRGTEPETIQEQMIWNNRRAWAEMVGTIYRPLDEAFVRSMAFMLTEEMDNCAEDYRQSDQHPIAAMDNESYEVPPAYSLPDRMNEYYKFLQNTGVHPLIKAAAAQAWLLVTRPFPEGNERLSRMMSSAVLLRCGYDFFRDISISAVIAKESYRYYKCMREIIRSENGGDLTYFMEYYLELLVRAMDSHKERLMRREQEMLEREQEREKERLMREREMARRPLVREDAPSVDAWQPMESRALESRPLERQPLERGQQHESRPLRNEDLLGREDTEGKSPPGDGDFYQRLRLMEASKSESIRETARVIRNMLTRGITHFSRADWAKISGMNGQRKNKVCDYLVSHGLVKNVSDTRQQSDYVFTAFDINVQGGGRKSWPAKETHADVGNRCQGVRGEPHASVKDQAASHIEYAPEFIARLTEMAKNEESERDKRIGRFLLKMIQSGTDTLTIDDWMAEFLVSRKTCVYDIRRAVNLGLMKKKSEGSGRWRYEMLRELPKGIRCDDLSKIQKECLSRLYRAFGDREFSVEDASMTLGEGGSSAYFHLVNFTERDIMIQHRHPGEASAFQFVISPKDYPQCFADYNTGSVPLGDRSAAAVRVPLAAASA